MQRDLPDDFELLWWQDWLRVTGVRRYQRQRVGPLSSRKPDSWQLCIRWQAYRLGTLRTPHPFREVSLEPFRFLGATPLATGDWRALAPLAASFARRACRRSFLSWDLVSLFLSEDAPAVAFLVCILFHCNLPRDHISTRPREAREAFGATVPRRGRFLEPIRNNLNFFYN